MQREASFKWRWYLGKMSRVILTNGYVLGRELLYKLNSWGMIVILPELGHREKKIALLIILQRTQGEFGQTDKNRQTTAVTPPPMLCSEGFQNCRQLQYSSYVCTINVEVSCTPASKFVGVYILVQHVFHQ